MPHCFEECTFVIFGATGDLSKRKIIPAIYKLIEDKKLCRFAIVGLSFEEISVDHLLKRSQPFIKKSSKAIWEKLASHFFYYQMDFHDVASYQGLDVLVNDVEQKLNLSGNRVFYLATMPDHFVDITQHLATSGLAKQQQVEAQPWYRVVYEKPFGHDYASSKTINHAVTQTFNEHQIFRIDHYLGKELVGNIVLSRFTNTILEPLWNNKYIDEVQIILSEKIGVEDRGSYYDAYGAIKDMVQSHMLQLLALVAIEQPKKLSAQYVRDAKSAILENTVVESVIRGQYEGYCQEKNVAPTSDTETLVAVKLTVNNDRWQGVPFYLKTGKCLDEKVSCIYIKFKQFECLLTSCPSKANCFVIKIYPDEGLYLGFNTKIPGIPDEVAPITMDFCHSCLFGPNTPAAYETLLSDVINGDQSAFVRSDEVEKSWRIVENILRIKGPCYAYQQSSKGPKELKNLEKEKAIDWYA